MALILLLLVPLLTGLVLVAAGRAWSDRTVLGVGLGAASLTLVFAVVTSVQRPVVDRAWLPELGVRSHFSVDGISIPLVLLTAIIGLLVVIHAFEEVPTGGTTGGFVGCLLLVVGGALATFAARDVIMFFLAFELVLVPMWALITRYGDPHRPVGRVEAGWRFVLYTAFGSALMLVGILLLVASTGTSDMGELLEAGAALSGGRQLTIALLLVVGLAVKVPVFPLHTWLPSAHTIAPTAGSVLLAAVLLKMGTYGLVRLPLGMVPEGFAAVAPWLAIAGVTGIIWGGLVCLVERDLKRLIAYSSVAHMGFVVLSIASGTEAGVQAALYGNLAHGVISALLFVIVGGLKRRWGVVDLGQPLPSLREIAPARGFFLILGLAAALGLPGLAGFWGEFFAILAAWSPADPATTTIFRTCAVVAAIGGALAAAYCLRVARVLWAGDSHVEWAPNVGPGPMEPTPSAHSTEEVGTSRVESADRAASGGPVGTSSALSTTTQEVETVGIERAVHVVLAVGIFALGLLPWLVINLMQPAVRTLIGGQP